MKEYEFYLVGYFEWQTPRDCFSLSLSAVGHRLSEALINLGQGLSQGFVPLVIIDLDRGKLTNQGERK